MTAAQRFAGAILHEYDKQYGDVGGDTIHDAAVAFGLIAPVRVTEPCGDDCNCAEYGTFPQDCFRLTAEGDACAAAYREVKP